MRNGFFYTMGIVFLILAKIKHVLTGYSTPKPYGMKDAARCAAYDIEVVRSWAEYLQEYTDGRVSIAGASVLELGPGSDLGTGACLLARGARTYTAVDAHPLANQATDGFYNVLGGMLGTIVPGVDPAAIISEACQARLGATARMSYVVRPDFDLAQAVEPDSFDIVFSQAAFEHFENPGLVLRQLASVCREDAILLAVIDLATHSRWIRERDPDNIYRYGPEVYDALKYRGIPNRARPFEYCRMLESEGWTNVVVLPGRTLASDDLNAIHFAPRYRTSANEMGLLAVIVCATLTRSHTPC